LAEFSILFLNHENDVCSYLSQSKDSHAEVLSVKTDIMKGRVI